MHIGLLEELKCSMQSKKMMSMIYAAHYHSVNTLFLTVVTIKRQ